MDMYKTTLVWFRQDLRVEDNPALSAAVENGDYVTAIYLWSPEEEKEWSLGGASRWWLHHSLHVLKAELEALSIPLIIRKGPSLEALKQLAKDTLACGIYWNRRYEPFAIERDSHIKSELNTLGLEAKSYNAHLLFEPWTIYNKQKKPYQVFTPFWNTCLSQFPSLEPLPIPKKMLKKFKNLHSIEIQDLNLMPPIRWDADISANWKPGTEEAKRRLNEFIKQEIKGYLENRDLPDHEGVSRLSPYLHFGEISPRMIGHAIQKQCKLTEEGPAAYLRQLGWREFAYHLLFHFPKTPLQPLRKEFERFPWASDESALKKWEKGLTGFPIVDAGMRQLWKTGWMHNRVRLIVGSFLVKDLLIPWQKGAKWFWDTLLDADLANNTLGWQWVAGCGADAAPYFRIFNPITQSEKFDPSGNYIRQWVPELNSLPDRWIHKPWEASELVLKEAAVVLGATYPYPIVDHAAAREKALSAFAKLRSMDG